MRGLSRVVNCKEDFNFIKEICLEKGQDIGETKEFYDATIFGDAKDKNEIIDFAVNNNMTELMFWMASVVKYKTPAVDCKNYIAKDYMNIHVQIVEAVRELINFGKETRRAVVMFPKWHCFSSVQFIYNREKIGCDLIDCICTMRSCNIEKNLASDMLLCYLMASELDNVYKKKLNEEDVNETKVRVTMHIGSLHCFITKKRKEQ